MITNRYLYIAMRYGYKKMTLTDLPLCINEHDAAVKTMPY